MTSRAENELLTQTDHGTPCGELMRRYWQPVALAEELPAGGAPLPVRLLGEDLVLFRDEGGRPGLIGLHCAHRGADLSYGRIEDGGLRCLYHGWLYDRAGRCLEQPGEPRRSTFHERISQTAYPCAEAGGLILAYLRAGEAPSLPAFEFLRAPAEYRVVTKILHNCSYLQSLEGNVDPQHTSFLHRVVFSDHVTMGYIANDGAPTIDAETLDFGVRVYSVRQITGERNYVRTTYFILPDLSAFGSTCDGYQINWHVPIDDAHHWEYVIAFNRVRPFDEDGLAPYRHHITSDYRLMRNAENRYLQDRASMNNGYYAGLGPDFYDHDLWATESQGPTKDRAGEHLGYTDRGVVASRNALLRAVLDVKEGRDPPSLSRDGARLVGISIAAEVIPSSVNWQTEWEKRPPEIEERSWPLDTLPFSIATEEDSTPPPRSA